MSYLLILGGNSRTAYVLFDLLLLDHHRSVFSLSIERVLRL